jgi:hypothetical protein
VPNEDLRYFGPLEIGSNFRQMFLKERHKDTYLNHDFGWSADWGGSISSEIGEKLF